MIQIRGLRKRLGSKQVLDGVDLDIATGETLVVMGPSGTGKSVLLKHIIGLMTPDEGSIEVDGEEIVGMRERDLNEVRKRFGMLFQGAALFDSMTVGENVGAGAARAHRGCAEPRSAARVAERLEWVGLKGVEDMKPASLSGGMRKRVGLARAIAMDPQFILYDEPTTGLDPIMADVIDQLIRDLQKRHRRHVDRGDARHDTARSRSATGMAMLHEGKIVVHGHARRGAHHERSAGAAVHRGLERGARSSRSEQGERRELAGRKSRSGITVLVALGDPAVGRDLAQGALSSQRKVRVWHVRVPADRRARARATRCR